MSRPRKKAVNALPQEKVKALGLFSQFHLTESYISLLLGIVVVIVAAVLLIGFAKNKNILEDAKRAIPQIASQKTDRVEELKKENASTYTVKEGDTLWSIAEKTYQSGFVWQEIARANKIENPVGLEKGTKLVIPNIQSKEIATSEILNKTLADQAEVKAEIVKSITGSSYTVARDDTLWDIAVRAYGDGYQWIRIAEANKLENPDLIFSGNQFTIPR